MTKQETKIEAAALSVDLVAAFAEIEGAAKDKVNPHFKSKYADLSSVIDAIKPVLARHNLAVYQRCNPVENGVSVQTILHHVSGEVVDLGTLYVPANKLDPQGFGSALTYCRRYALMTAFGVPAEDDDGNAAVKATVYPSAGEPAPLPREKLEGPYPSPTALKGAIKAFANTLSGMTDFAEFNAWMETPEVVELEKQAQRYLPDWWDEGIPDKPEFEPMTSRIHRKRQELEELDSIANSPGAKLMAAG
jgi:hypothetical protein